MIMERADSITVRYLSLAILFANAAPPYCSLLFSSSFRVFATCKERCEAISHTAVPPAKAMYYSRSVMYLSQRAVLGAVKAWRSWRDHGVNRSVALCQPSQRTFLIRPAGAHSRHVRFTPKAGKRTLALLCPLSANSDITRCSKFAPVSAAF